MSAIADRGARFRALHEGEPFVIPNPWDAGSAKVLAAHGFPALATTSSGFAFTLGRLDGAVSLGEVVAHVALVAGATDLPLSVDLENGYGDDPSPAIRQVAVAGAVGASIEDWDGGRLYEPEHAAARVAAAAAAARELDFPFTLTARAENHIRGVDDLADTVARLELYAQAGAHVLYAPGIRTEEQIRAVCAVGRPVNVLALPGMRFADLAAAGAQRVSVGGGLAWTAAHALAAAAEAIRDSGDFSVLRPGGAVRDWLA